MRINTQPYEHNGVRTLNAIAKANDVSVTAIKARLSDGWDIEAAVNWAVSQAATRSLTKCEWRGAKGLPAIARKAGVSEGGIRAYVKQGKTVDEAIKAVKADRARVIEAQEEKRARRNSPFKKKLEGIRKPCQLNPLWGLALGMSL